MTVSGIRTFSGLAPDMFAGDAATLGLFRNALYKEDKFAPEAFQNRQNFFAERNDHRDRAGSSEPINCSRPGARLGHSLALRSCAGSPGIPLGSSSRHEYFHARYGHEGIALCRLTT